ncbi:MAG: HD domain-containing phosphohydrolase [Chloroflexota bacterium]
MHQESKILIIDDEPSILEALQELLTLEGYVLTWADNGAQALEKAAQVMPDLILLDVMLPAMDGFEVCRRLRADPILAQVPVVMLTALADSESRLKGIKAGADEFLAKPFDSVELLARVRTITQLNRYRRLVQEKTKFERVIELSPNGILIVDGAHRILLASPAAHRLLQNPQELLGVDFCHLVAPAQAEQCAAFLAHAMANESTVARTEMTFVRSDGSRFPAEVEAGHFTWQEQPAAQVVFRDISERKQAEEQLHRQLQRLTTLRHIDQAITAGLDLQATLEAFLAQMIQHLRLDAVSILLLDPRAQALEYAAGRGFCTPAISTTRLRLDQSHAAGVAPQRRIVSMPKLDKDSSGFIQRRGLEGEGFVSYYAAPLIHKGEMKGLLEVFNRTYLPADAQWLEFLEALATQAIIAIENAELFNSLQHTHAELSQAYDATLEGWSKALELRDKETKDHTRRVTEMTVRLARAMGLSSSDLVPVRRGALLHDIGKMGIPDGILLKPGPLTPVEEEIMRRHPIYAYEMLAAIDYLRSALDIPYCHHEKWDGTGYPRGLRGTEIPLAARIFAVVDVWDALRSDRPYRQAWPEPKVRAYIREQAGQAFDPQVVKTFLKMDWSLETQAP